MKKARYLGVLLVTVGAAACGTEPGTGEADTSSGAKGGSGGASGAAVSGGASGSGTGGSAMTGGAAGNTVTGGSGVGGSATGGAGASGMPAGSGGTATGGGGATGGGAGGRAGAGADAGSSGTGATGGVAGMGKAGTGGGAGSGGGAGTGGSAGSSGNTCNTPLALSPLVGWASVSPATTGGGNAAPTTVSNLTDFTNAVKGTNAAVIYVKGVLAAGKVSVGSNKTISGLCGAEVHGHLELSGSTNVIINNLKIVGYAVGNCALDPDYDSGTGCSSGTDAVTVQKNASHIWFDHDDISDGTDGNLDITNAANYVTVSWTKFHYTARTDNNGSDSTGAAGHRYSNLIGGTDNPSSYDDANALNVTWHHNWWADRVVERQPRVRFGKNHLFNNLWSSTGDNYCVRAGKQARILVENGVFAGVKDPTQFNSSTDQGTANIQVSGNDYSTATGKQETGGGGPAIGTLPYSYTADAVNTVSTAVQAGAGVK